jgi:hypothetical protein
MGAVPSLGRLGPHMEGRKSLTLLYVFIRRQEGDRKETVIPSAKERELSRTYD